jgi:predicted ATPase
VREGPAPAGITRKLDPEVSFSDAVAEYEGLLTAYPANGYEVELIPKAGVEERADFLEERLQRLSGA